MDQPCAPQMWATQSVAKETTSVFNVEQIAEVAHEANRVIQRIAGDDVSPPWKDAPDWQRESAIEGVNKALRPSVFNPLTGDQSSHDSWMEKKLRDGWRYGPKKDGQAKTHPCLLPFGSLPPEQKAKDGLFLSIAHALNSYRK